MKIQVDTAVAVPVNVYPLIDDTDFKTRETGIVYNQSGMDLVWNFVTTAGVFTQTALTPTTAGDYDWTHKGDGMYEIEIPASGGASINNDTEGSGWFSGICDGVLAWISPIYEFSPANVVNSLVNGTDNLQVDQTQLGGSTQSATDLKDFADEGYDPSTNKVQGVVLVDTTTTNTDMRGTDSAALAATALTNVTWTDARAGYLDNINGHTAQTGDSYAIVNSGTFGNAQLVRATTPANTLDISVSGNAGIDWNNIDSPTATVVLSNTTVGTTTTNTDMRGTDNAALASVCTESRLSELDAANIPADVDTLLTRVPDTISLANIQGEVDTALANYDGPTKAEMDAGHALLATPAQVNTEVLDVLTVDTFSQPGQESPAPTQTLAVMIAYGYKVWRNKSDQDSTTYNLYDDAGTTVDQKATLSDDGTDFTKGEIVSGP